MAEPIEIRIRESGDEDLPKMLNVLQECPEAASWADSAPALIAETAGAMAGFVLYRIVAGEGEVLNLAVIPEFRRQGIASALLKTLVKRCTTWHLEVRESNRGAICLYEENRFAIVGRRERYYSDGEAALLMSRIS
jgi:ribosomal-protein-alanine N-acetyltransferase